VTCIVFFEIVNVFLLLLSLKANKLPIHYYLSLTFSTVHAHIYIYRSEEAEQWFKYLCVFLFVSMMKVLGGLLIDYTNFFSLPFLLEQPCKVR